MNFENIAYTNDNKYLTVGTIAQNMQRVESVWGGSFERGVSVKTLSKGLGTDVLIKWFLEVGAKKLYHTYSHKSCLWSSTYIYSIIRKTLKDNLYKM